MPRSKPRGYQDTLSSIRFIHFDPPGYQRCGESRGCRTGLEFVGNWGYKPISRNWSHRIEKEFTSEPV
jgi:hypothetical protein